MSFPNVLFTKEYSFSVCDFFLTKKKKTPKDFKASTYIFIFIAEWLGVLVWDLPNGCCDMDLLTWMLNGLTSSSSWDHSHVTPCTCHSSAFPHHWRWSQLHCPAGLRLWQCGPCGHSHCSFCDQPKVRTEAPHAPSQFSSGGFCLPLRARTI